jgi:hypothetical protein
MIEDRVYDGVAMYSLEPNYLPTISPSFKILEIMSISLVVPKSDLQNINTRSSRQLETPWEILLEIVVEIR